MATCAGCLSAVPKTHGRRKLYGSSSVHVLAELKYLAAHGGYSVSGSNSILPAESDPEKSFLCLKCFNLLQRIAKMRKDLAKLEGELEANMIKTAASLGVQAASVRTVTGSGKLFCFLLEPGLPTGFTLLSTCTYINCMVAAMSEVPSTPSRRMESQGALTPQPRKRRRRISTPVRLTELVRAERSPAVSVSTCTTMTLAYIKSL